MLSNGELRQELKKLGLTVGPITDTTRALYVSRLEKLRKENAEKLPVARVQVRKLRERPVKIPGREGSSPQLRSLGQGMGYKSTVGYSTDESEEDSPAKNLGIEDGLSTNSNKNITKVSKQNANRYTAAKDITKMSRTPVGKQAKLLPGMRRPASSPSTPTFRHRSRPEVDEQYSGDSEDSLEGGAVMNNLHSVGENTSSGHYSSHKRLFSSSQFDSKSGLLHEPNAKKEKTNVPVRHPVVHGRRSMLLQGDEKNDKLDSRANDAAAAVTQEQPQSRHFPGERSGNTLSADMMTSNFSSILVIIVCIFFIIVGLLYTTLKYDTSLNSELQLGYNFPKNSTKEYLEIANMIYDYVGTYAGKRECDNIEDQGVLTVTQVIKHLNIEKGVKNTSLQMALAKFVEKPEWGITIFDKEMEPLNDITGANVVFLDSKQPILSGWCRLTRAMAKVFFRMLLTITAGFVIWLGIAYRRHRFMKRQEEREQVYIMVQKIIDSLRKQYNISENTQSAHPYLPILHVRDMLIAPQERKKMSKVWEKAVNFVSTGETRIRVENQRILGEDYIVWRWIQATSPAKRHTPTSRVWQGEAFDIKTSINRPMICPTPCLKIRNVFDSNMEVSDNWIEQIQDSILEKCQDNNGILQICVEKNSKEGLVYMMCATNQAAGQAFQALHGAWFDGRLITVKFIRLHRFHHRFPDSVNKSKIPMRPTSSVPVSTILYSPSNGGDGHYEKLYPSLPDA